MKIRSLMFGVLAAGCRRLAPTASAQVSDEDFNALKDMVQKLGQQVQELMKTHDQDQKTHEAGPEENPELGAATGRNQNRRHQRGPEGRSGGPGAIGLPGRQRPARARCITSRWWATRKFSLARPPGSTAPLRWPILRRSSCSGRATTCCSKPASTSCCRTTPIRTATARQAARLRWI